MSYSIHISNLLSNSKFYGINLPDPGDFVLGKIISYDELGIHIFLPEFQSNAFLNFKDASHAKRLKIIEKELQIDKEYLFIVDSIEKEKSYIILNRTNVTKEENTSEMSRIMSYRSIMNIFFNEWVNQQLAEYWGNENELTSSNLLLFFSNTLYSIDKDNINSFIKYSTKWFEYPDKFDKYISKMSWSSTDLKSNIVSNIKSHYKKPLFSVKANLTISCTYLNAIDKLKLFLSNLKEFWSIDELYIDTPPSYLLIWNNLEDPTDFQSTKNISQLKDLLSTLELSPAKFALSLNFLTT